MVGRWRDLWFNDKEQVLEDEACFIILFLP